MRLPNRWCLTLPLLLLMPACSKPRYTYDVDAAFRPDSYRTMAADPRTDRILIREGMRPLNPSLHLQAVLVELEARHFKPAAPAEADLWVAVYVLTEGSLAGGRGGAGKAEPREGSGGGRHGGGRGAAGGGREAGSPKAFTGGGHGAFTIVVQLQDRKTGESVWQGSANLDPREPGPDGRPLSPEEAVRQLLKPLPAQP